METTLKSKKVSLLDQHLKLIDGTFTSSESNDILSRILDVKINFHKLQRLSKTEGNMNDSCMFDSDRITELINAKHEVQKFLTEARLKGKKLKINSSVSIGLEE
ncbi:hypothetical protein F6U93_04590 [Tamlana haliotis]|uniref:Uncharacterized protein n=1 Tax=Pseudotamlana haliotis TaxID=2614804 RepID=A0A6N6MFF5_9FLAO|nr:hypothetical protein [Tamlana haliotis]KAB1069036.1 hypothetical protein F6U93_04590 [Tamlana haliotis]